jgi:NAD(P)-dependent dehydrogenase (short-subunit alcohol dehydrogenase family)
MVDTAKDLRRDLTGKVALVVGAGPGLGRACAVAFANDGADVVVSARRPEPLAELAAEVAAETGRRIEPIVSDLSDLDSLVALVDEATARLGGVDVLVTVATAGGGQIPIDEADWDMWRHAFQVNVIGTMEVSRCAARSMAQRGGGSIVHVSTFGTHSMPARQAAYTSTKQAAMTASKTMAKELGAQGIRVNVVTPGYITGEPLDQLFQGVSDRTGESIDQVSARMAKTAALRRHVDPEDIAEAVLFLCSERGRGVTGVEIPVTAGQHPL